MTFKKMKLLLSKFSQEHSPPLLKNGSDWLHVALIYKVNKTSFSLRVKTKDNKTHKLASNDTRFTQTFCLLKYKGHLNTKLFGVLRGQKLFQTLFCFSLLDSAKKWLISVRSVYGYAALYKLHDC
jgi:hypothetical protein